MQPARLVGAPFAACAQPAMPVGAQPEMFAADGDKDNANALLKLSSRARFSELAGKKIRGFVADLELYLHMCARPVHNWGYFLMVSLGEEEAEKVRRSHLADTIADYQKFKSGVKAMFSMFEFEGSFSAQLLTHAQYGAESIAAYPARTTDVCSRNYPAFATETQLSLAVDHFITGLANTTTGDNLLHHRACRSLKWQEVVQMAQAYEASRLSPHAAAAAVTASTKFAALANAKCPCAHNNLTAAPAWQSKSARDGRAKQSAHSSRKDEHQARASAPRTPNPQQDAPATAVHEQPPPYTSS